MEAKKEGKIILNLLELNSSETIQIKIQTFDSVFPLTIKRGASIQDLKEKISEVKLIFLFVSL